MHAMGANALFQTSGRTFETHVRRRPQRAKPHRVGQPDLVRCRSQDLTRIRLGMSLSLLVGTQSGSPAIRPPLTNNSPSLSAAPPVSMRYPSALQLGSSFVTLAAALFASVVRPK